MDESVRTTLLEGLREIFPRKQLLTDALMSGYTTLRLGGPADVLADVSDASQPARALKLADSLGVPMLVIGNGSNLLVRDGGFRGLVLRLGDAFSQVSDPVPLPDGRFALSARGGTALIRMANAAADAGLTGLEFAGGIPGTVGGAVYMNAGAYGGEMKNVISLVTAVSPSGENRTYTAEELRMGYRHSALMETGDIVTGVTVSLLPGDSETVHAAMREFNARRREKQPVQLPSCGSTFKRPDGYFAGTLIEQCGLKGARVGGCSVSTLHAGFLVNDEEGTAADYEALIGHVRKTVFEKTGVMLEPEVRVVGEN